MKIKAIILGSTGMIGQGVLLECLENPHVESVLTINRRAGNIQHTKLTEIIHGDIVDLSSLTVEIKGYNTCFFCLGVSSAGLSEKEYYKITYDLTIHVANTLLKANKDLIFCYISGAGTDSSEKGRMMWARVKGKTENVLLSMPFKDAYMFRPAFIQPMRGIKSRTRVYNALYTVFKPFYFILKHFSKYVTNTDTLSRAMIHTVMHSSDKKILENVDINRIGNMN